MVPMMRCYICDNYDEIERELNGDEYEESKKHIIIFVLPATKKCY